MSASVGENTLITINFMSDCFMLFYLMTSTLLLRWGVFKWNEIPEQMPEAPSGSRAEEIQWGQAGRKNLAWHKGKFGWKPQRVSLRVAELEPLFRVKPGSHRTFKIPLVTIRAGTGLSAKLLTNLLSPGMVQDLGNGFRMELERHLDSGLGTLLHCPSDPRTCLHGLSASAVIFSFVKS